MYRTCWHSERAVRLLDEAISELKNSCAKVVVDIGTVTLEAGAYYGRTVPILNKELNGEMVTFPGHHGSYMVNPSEWTTTLRDVLSHTGVGDDRIFWE